MNPEKQRLAIAKACGWTFIDEKFIAISTRMPSGWDYIKSSMPWFPYKFDTQLFAVPPWVERPLPYPTLFTPNVHYVCCVPDYLNDLNAMHEAETVLPKDLRACWMIELCKITDDSFWATTRATAAQRAEAFLRTLNLWL